jgi:hypothetical protein
MLINPPEKMEKAWRDSIPEITARYQSIADDLTEVVDAESNKINPEVSFLDNPVFEGYYGKFQTAALILSISYYESNFHRLVDNGKWRGDGGRSWCLMQVHLGNGTMYLGDEEMRKWTGQDLVQDRKKCFKAGLAIIKQSINDCSKKGMFGFDLLSEYTTGSCIKNSVHAHHRWYMADNFMKLTDIPKDKSVFINPFVFNSCQK